MTKGNLKIGKIDFTLIFCYVSLIIIGWLNIYSSLYTEDNGTIFDFSQKYGMQFVWIGIAFITAIGIMFFFNSKIYNVLSPVFYIFACILLLAVIFLGKEVNGSKSWFVLGPVSFQPAEISKISTSLFLAYIMSKYGFKLNKFKDAIKVALLILIPMLIIIMEKETGSALVYCGFVFVLYREGLSGLVILFGLLMILLFVVTLIGSPLAAIIILFLICSIGYATINKKFFKHLLFIVPCVCLMGFLPKLSGIKWLEFLNVIKVEHWGLIISGIYFAVMGLLSLRQKKTHFKFVILCYLCSMLFIFSVQFIFNNVMQPHQKARIENLLGITEDLKGVGYNVNQSKIAIGSGGFVGKGYLQGTQTKFNFVPEQSTDFIFCTIGEEWGFLGGAVVIALYLILIIRLIQLSEKQKDKFSRIYGYCVAACFFMHVFINIGMTMGIVPVIGIPLPFISYGGSALLSFTILLFIFVRLNMDRWNN